MTFKRGVPLGIAKVSPRPLPLFYQNKDREDATLFLGMLAQPHLFFLLDD